MLASSILLSMAASAHAFQSASFSRNSPPVFAVTNDDASVTSTTCPQRRKLMSRAVFSTAGLYTSSFVPQHPCRCCLQQHVPHYANALVDLTPPSPSLANTYDPDRNKVMDSVFSWSMATTMDEYEEEARPYKIQLFQSLFDSLVADKNSNTLVIVEVGMGTFPNAPYLAQAIKSANLAGLDIIGVDPNDSMKQYALENAQRSALQSTNNSLRIVHGVAEALPFADASVDAVVLTLTLCSVTDPERAVSEIKRVLKPGGKFLFWEHVLSEKDGLLALQQQILSPLQSFVADGCHLNRRTGSIITNAGFRGGVDLRYTTMESVDIIGPTVYGIATA